MLRIHHSSQHESIILVVQRETRLNEWWDNADKRDEDEPRRIKK
jgi:hypothetical protein